MRAARRARFPLSFPAALHLRLARDRAGIGWTGGGALAVALLVTLPVAGLAFSVFAPGTPGVWSHLAQTVLPRYLANSVLLALAVALGVALVGVACAWATAGYDFPGRRWLEWALVLPLAMPAYVVAYAYTDFLQFSGPVQSALRALTGWRAREYWFPEIRSLPGAAALFVLVLFPYVYLPVRAAFLERSPNLLDVARLSGLGAAAAFWRAVLPLARPALAAGIALAVMETLADYGAVSYFALETLTIGIYKAWFGLGDRAAAAQLSLLLLGAVALVMWAEHASRGRARFQGSGTLAARRIRLAGASGWAAALLCFMPVLLGFLLPAAILLRLAVRDIAVVNLDRYADSMLNSFAAAGLSALAATVLALLLAYAVRLHPVSAVRAGARLSALGYAVPGAVLAVAILVPLARLDNALDAFLQAHFGWNSGLLFTGSVTALVYAYVVRFLALALSNAEAGLARITPSMDEAARSLGCGPVRLAARVHAPLLARSLLIGMLLVFVDGLKELPATLVLRPFDFDTLATQAYNLAKDERLGEAALPSLTMVAVGLIPLVLVSGALGRRKA
jgi:iron(III) transport system permease protein